jgi:hypothetical protein
MNKSPPTYQTYVRGGLGGVKRSEFNSLGPKEDKRVEFKNYISDRLLVLLCYKNGVPQ